MRDDVNMKPVDGFAKEYPHDARLLESYPEVTHYSVDDRGNLVLYKNNVVQVYINSLSKDINF